MAKKLLAFLLTFALILSTVATVAIVPSSAADVTVWDGTIATAFAGGTGTKDDPYQISNGAQLAYMFNSVITTGSSFCNNKYFKLTADIYLNDVTKADWKENDPNPWLVSIATNGYRFTGNFDGAGHTVYGMYYSGDSGYVGLLPVMDTWSYDTVVKDLTISDSYISTSGSIIGVVSPRLYSGNYKTAHFYNINIKDSVTIESSDASAYVGGILGFSNCDAKSYYQFSGCSVLADISSGHAFIGSGSAATIANIIQSYSNAADWYPTNSKTSDTTYLISDIETIKGATAAKEAMPGLDWLRIWNCSAEGTPYAMNYNTNNVVGRPWSGLWAQGYAGGSGTSDDPYIIETAEQLAKMVRFGDTTGGYYKITKDIYLNDVSNVNWKTNSPKSWYDKGSLPLDKDSKTVAFVGNVDGTGHTIYGLYYNGANIFGLIPYAQNTYIGNLRISQADITSTGAIAALVGQGVTKVSFAYCAVDETVNITGSGDTAGYIAYGTQSVYIDSSSATANIKGATNVGAFIGDCWYNSTVGTVHVINNSFGVGHPLDAKLGFTASNCYNSVAETMTFTAGEVVNLEDAAKMQGAGALKNMPLLDFFGTTDTYPTIYQQGKVGAIWSGSVAADYAKGSGTANDPYIIETAEQLVKLVKDANTAGKYYEITADIMLNDTSVDNWQENAKQWFNNSAVPEFGGTLNGGNNTISGIYYNGSAFASLIPRTSGTTVFKNISIISSSLATNGTDNENNVSAIVSRAYGNITFDNCMVDDTVELVSSASAAGLAGYGTANITIKNCGVAAKITATRRLGAFTSDFWGGTHNVSNSYAVGNPISGNRTFTGSNNYSTVSDKYGTNVVTLEQMQGMNALENMPLLTGYYATDSYPVRYNDGVEGSVWSGAVASSFTSGIGTQADPYIITTGEQLARIFTVSTKGYYFALGTDILLGNDETVNNWFDSSNAKTFEGVLDGNNYIVSGLNYDKTVTSLTYAGLVPAVNGGTVKNIILEDSSIKMTTNVNDASYVGGIVGYNTGKAIIFNCYVAEDVAISNTLADGITTDKASIGGILGGGQAAFEIDGCAFLGTIEHSNYRYGAVFGDVWKGTISDRIVNNTFADNYTPSSYWGFTGRNNVSTVAVPDGKDGKDSFNVVATLKGEDGLKNIEVLNRHGRYFGTESYPLVCALGTRFEDANGDRESNALDLTLLRNKFIGNTTLGNGDVNGDNFADARDIVFLKKQQAEKKTESDYELVWFDEFEGDSLDESKWNTAQTRMADTGELAQSNAGYVRSVSDGNLQLSAIENPYYNADGTYFEQHKYTTTTSVTTENKMSFKYGYVEIKAKVPYKEGCWPSFWLRSHNATGKLSNPKFEVEVDVFEVFGNTTSMASNLHQQNYDGKSYQTKNSDINAEEVHTFDNAENLSKEYHIYGFEWEPDRMAVYVDGVKQCEWKLDVWTLWWNYGMKMNNSGFNTTMNILFNNHLFTESSTYAPSEDNIIENHEDNLPAEFDIDYVRLYQKNDGNSVLILGE